VKRPALLWNRATKAPTGTSLAYESSKSVTLTSGRGDG
jgi:hypothetical protein